MEVVAALARHWMWSVIETSRQENGHLTKAAVIARVFACWACAVKVDLADAADVVLGDIPPPRRDGVPAGNLDLHDAGVSCKMDSGCCFCSLCACKRLASTLTHKLADVR